ncbi:hypothetical protein HJG54_31665 [Leptolyngbya sp. NK1-12]|uniref:Uncharacterized protein n=1 Tax=Leptolyngbya sp. NK1-12 TaxID=2547451 RepID=A0AA96WLL7_9CYAN|nr:hypothetical protein [Leptolyngbya sp. NK1-12]MBF2046955.1 hypothetical protein [Elainella sp. C42_A2020_010]RNJ68774.1 MAG: hypothetical protein EDM05_14000 [Leptolyngbya sp. IPPAS B-1204]WNZ27439.1 hypothetical protein HJG54_31665 [Leptolyngbya sp. NK1-12]
MTTEFNELLPVPPSGKTQIWIVGQRDEVLHLINEFTVKRIATDRSKFTPLVPAPFAAGQYMTVLVR